MIIIFATCFCDFFCRCLVSKLFDVCSNSTLEEMEQQDEVKVAWGMGIAGHVAESGEPVNIPDAYQVCLFKILLKSIRTDTTIKAYIGLLFIFKLLP